MEKTAESLLGIDVFFVLLGAILVFATIDSGADTS